MDRSVAGFTSIAHMAGDVEPAAGWVGDGVLKAVSYEECFDRRVDRVGRRGQEEKVSVSAAFPSF